MRVCGGWARCVCLYLKLQTSVLPLAREILTCYRYPATVNKSLEQGPRGRALPLFTQLTRKGVLATSEVVRRLPWR